MLAKSGLACRLTNVPTITRIERQIVRAELAAEKILLFDPDYAMAEGVQIDVDGVRYQPIRGTFSVYRDWNGNNVYKRCDLLRQEV